MEKVDLSIIVSWRADKGLVYTPALAELVSPPAIRDYLPYLRECLREESILAPDDDLYLARVRASEYALLKLNYDPLTRQLASEHLFTYKQSSRGATPVVVDDRVAFDAVVKAMQSAPLRGITVSRALVKKILGVGGVRVRELGGTYFIPAYAVPVIEPLLDALEAAGAFVQRMPIERSANLLQSIARDAIASFHAALADLHSALKRAATEARRRNLLNRIQEIKRWVEWYQTALGEMRVALDSFEQETTLDLLAGLGEVS